MALSSRPCSAGARLSGKRPGAFLRRLEFGSKTQRRAGAAVKSTAYRAFLVLTDVKRGLQVFVLSRFRTGKVVSTFPENAPVHPHPDDSGSTMHHHTRRPHPALPLEQSRPSMRGFPASRREHLRPVSRRSPESELPVPAFALDIVRTTGPDDCEAPGGWFSFMDVSAGLRLLSAAQLVRAMAGGLTCAAAGMVRRHPSAYGHASLARRP
jgi:hypothetical protein